MGAEQSAEEPPAVTVEEVVEETGRGPSALVICGPSGVGKGTLIELLTEDCTGFEFCISHTTRPPRDLDLSRLKDGVEYHFTTREAFEKGIEENKFLEYAFVHDSYYYGTSRAAAQKVLDSGACCILDIDVQGARQVRKSGLRSVFVFIAPPSEDELEKRLRGRGTETEAQIRKRLKAAQSEMQSMNEPELFDFCIVNGELSQAYAELRLIALRARSGVLPEALDNGLLSPTKSEAESRVSVRSMADWKQKIALVTDAGSPIGMELSAALSRAGMRVIAVGRNRNDLEKLQGNIIGTGISSSAQNFLPVVCDMTKEGEVLSLRRIAQKRWPNAAAIDVLINIASFAPTGGGLVDGSAAIWAEMLNLNILGMLMCTRSVITDMRNSDGPGVVINVSALDKDAPSDSISLFNATTHAVQSLTTALRTEIKAKGSNVNVLSITSNDRINSAEVARSILSILAANVDVSHISL